MKDLLDELVPGKSTTGDLMHAFRLNGDLSISWLSDQTSIPTDTLCAYENGEQMPTEEHFELIADALGVRVKDLK